MALTFTDANFQAEVLDSKGVVVVDFWATWCGPCRIQGPIVDSLADKYASEANLKMGKLDVDENNQTAMAYKVLSIPTMAIFKGGELMETLVGLRSETDLEEKIKYYLNS
jgi:thioredoxin 1